MKPYDDKSQHANQSSDNKFNNNSKTGTNLGGQGKTGGQGGQGGQQGGQKDKTGGSTGGSKSKW